MSYVATKTKYQAEAVLNTMNGAALSAWTPWLGLLVDIPDPFNGDVTEADHVFDTYARKVASFGSPINGAVTIDTLVAFELYEPSDLLYILAIGVYDAETDGNLRYVIPLATPYLMRGSGFGGGNFLQPGMLVIQER